MIAGRIFGESASACGGSPRSLQQYHIPMKLQEPALPRNKLFNVHGTLRVDPHPLQRWPVCDRRDNQVAVALKPDEAPIK
jgi:hypothetical protein